MSSSWAIFCHGFGRRPPPYYYPHWLSSLSSLLLIGLLWLDICQAYRVGDAVHTDLLLGTVSTDVLRIQMPLFAQSSQAQFHLDPKTTQVPHAVALTFEDGLWGIPTVALQNRRGEHLEHVEVTFVYSKSGRGAIHAVSSSHVAYSSHPRSNEAPSFRVSYKWVEEEAVYLTAGYAVMFLVVFLACSFFILASCGLFDEFNEEQSQSATDEHDHHHSHIRPSTAQPKWD